MQIRNYQPHDREFVIALWNTVFPDPAEHNDPGQSIDRKVAENDHLFFVAVDDQAVVGTVLAGYDGHRGWLYSVAVDPTRRRQGIGSKLVKYAEQKLNDLGCPKLNLQILSDNSNVVDFYDSLGYKLEERINMGKLI